MSRPGSGASTPAGPASRPSSTGPGAATAAGAAAGRQGGSVNQDLSSLLGLPLHLALSNGTYADGNLWAYDASLGVVVLETGVVPSSAGAALNGAAAAPATRERAGAAKRTGFRIIKVREVKSIEVAPSAAAAGSTAQNGVATQQNGATAAVAAAGADELTAVHPVSVSAAESREMAAIRDGAARAARIGVGVSEIGQEVFDALSKTLPCRWHETHIIVLDEVVISGPAYDLSSCNVPSFTQDQLRSLASGAAAGAGAQQAGAQAKANSWTRVQKVLEGERNKILARQQATART